MELTNRMIEKYLKLSKKQKSQMITQYCELTHVKRATAVNVIIPHGDWRKMKEMVK
ncbi:MAG TPA: hypothetical protein PK894_07450 [Defluviitoga sp.]|nr:hypothetical protein [Defluviitoga sp.]